MKVSQMQKFINNNELTIKTRVLSEKRKEFEGEVYSITSENDHGVFDILPNHANFISIIRNFAYLNLPGGDRKSISLTEGVLKFVGNNATIYITVLDK